jgi:hypothetical protein
VKSPPFAGLSALKKEYSIKAGLAGWRRSADRTGLYWNSLLTGKFKEKTLEFPQSG